MILGGEVMALPGSPSDIQLHPGSRGSVEASDQCWRVKVDEVGMGRRNCVVCWWPFELWEA